MGKHWLLDGPGRATLGEGVGVPALPNGYSFMVDLQGNYLVDFQGNYLIMGTS